MKVIDTRAKEAETAYEGANMLDEFAYDGCNVSSEVFLERYRYVEDVVAYILRIRTCCWPPKVLPCQILLRKCPSLLIALLLCFSNILPDCRSDALCKEYVLLQERLNVALWSSPSLRQILL